MEALIRVKGKLTIEKIDRETGETLEKREIDNALVINGAYHIRYTAYIVDPGICASNPQTLRPNKLVLMDAARNFIKEIPNAAFSTTDTGTALAYTQTWNDTSTDTYTVGYAGIARASDTFTGAVNVNSALIHAAAVSPAFTKASSDTVKYTWTINIQYSTV